MGEKIVIVTIDAEGAVSTSVKGIKGKACHDVTRQLEEALGNVTSSMPTDEAKEVQGHVRRANFNRA